MKKKLVIYCALLLLLHSTALLAQNSPLKIIQSNKKQLVISFELQEYHISEKQGFTFIDAPGFYNEKEEGAALLPEYSFLVGVPPDGDISFSISNQTDKKVYLQYPIAPSPRFEIGKDDIAFPVYEIQQMKYAPTLSPSLIEVSEPYNYRWQRVVRMTINPFRQLADGYLKITSGLSISINYKGNTEAKTLFTDNNFKHIFRNTIVNFEIARSWQLPKDESIKDTYDPFSYADEWFKIPIDQDGIYKITKSQLAKAGIPVQDLTMDRIKIFNGGGGALSRNVGAELPPLKEVPYDISESGDAIYFYARDPNGDLMHSGYSNNYYHPYAYTNIYWLTYNYEKVSLKPPQSQYKPFTAQRKNVISQFYFEDHFEEEKFRLDPAGKPFRWYWKELSGNITGSYTLEFPVYDVVASGDQKMYFYCATNTDLDSLRFYLNGQYIGRAYPTSGITVNLPASVNFQNGTNQIRIQLYPAISSSELILDYFEAKYYRKLFLRNNQLLFSPSSLGEQTFRIENVKKDELRIFKIYDFDSTVVIPVDDSNFISDNTLEFTDSVEDLSVKYYVVCAGGYRTPQEIQTDYIDWYFVSSGGQVGSGSPYLRNSENFPQTDMVIITPDEWYKQSQALADLHYAADSLSVLVARLSDVYDEFSWGVPDVVGIRHFLKYAFENYGESVAYTLLIGDGSTDFKHYESVTGERNKIPPFVTSSSCSVSDDYFVYFSISRPEMMIGRLPCQTSSHVDIVINKIEDYIMSSEYGPWRANVLLVADDTNNPEHSSDYVDSAAILGMETDCANRLREVVTIKKIYGIEYPFDEFQNKPGATEDILEFVNNGTTLFYYRGHGNPDQLGHEKYIVISRDLDKFQNKNRLTFFIAGACEVGAFQFNNFDSMAEKILLTPAGGSIASYASNIRGSFGPCNEIVKNLVNSADDDICLGEAILVAKNGGYPYYMFFGDPALRLAIPEVGGKVTIPQELPDSLMGRQTAYLEGTILDSINQYDKLFFTVYDTDYETVFVDRGWTFNYIKKGEMIFRGPVSCEQDTASLRFVVPDDIYGGDAGHIVGYAVNNEKSKDILIPYNKREDADDHRLIINGYSSAEQDGPPNINVWLDSPTFQNGDYVSSSPTLYAELVDSNGINIMNRPGHRILVSVDDSYEENITENFVYDLDSYTKGTIEYDFPSLSPGPHRLRLEAFDNFNEDNEVQIEFKVKEEGSLQASNVLNYPNPVKDETRFTFTLTEDAPVTIEIFTISGRSIKKITSNGEKGFNQVYWDARDADGDRLANGVYFYKVYLNSKPNDKIYKLIIAR
ncbi:MAG: type IX secretion system sortase PorU [Candidatus Cloacimonadia bacterium]